MFCYTNSFYIFFLNLSVILQVRSLCVKIYILRNKILFLKCIHSEAELFVKTAFVIFMNPEFRSSWHYIYILYHVFHHVMIDWYVFHVLSEVFQPFNYKAYRQFWRFRGSTLEPILLVMLTIIKFLLSFIFKFKKHFLGQYGLSYRGYILVINRISNISLDKL